MLSLIFIISGCSKNDNPNTTVPQPTIDSVTIGTQVWMKKNLDIDHYQNGDIIPEVKDFNVWRNLKTGAWHYYDNDSTNGNIMENYIIGMQ